MHRKDPQTGAWIEIDDLTQAAADVESDDGEFAAQVRDARSQIAKEEAIQRRLARAALTDPKVAAEFADSESRLRSAQQVLKYPDLVRQEDARIEAERLAAEDEKRRQLAQAAADRLAGQQHKVAQEFDRAAVEMAQALVRFEALGVELEQWLRKAGHPAGAGRSAGWAVTNALRAALGAAGARHNAIELPPVVGELRPLAEPETAE